MKSKLPDLPPSKDKWWSKAKKYKSDMSKVNPKCKHNFKSLQGRIARCEKCHIGFFLKGNEYIKKGHIYLGKQLLI